MPANWTIDGDRSFTEPPWSDASRMIVGRYSLVGPVRNAPRLVDYVHRAPDDWRASIADELVWLRNGAGILVRVDGRGLRSAAHDDSIVFRHPLPELTALSGTESVLLWLGMDEEPTWTTRDELYLDRAARRLTGETKGTRLRLVVDDRMGFVLDVRCERERGVLTLTTQVFGVVESDDRLFVHDAPVEEFDGARTAPL